ncbi:secondary thiamine-phosphate synthase enzyme YjbQ, partial [candidate division WOR-3 bacterium]|nr:secondary thiamine-phosphate synthase enzyme YjbQ [candidate division WOR-3 bacterium]
YSTNGKTNIIDITDKINSIVNNSRIIDGFVNVAVIGSTAGITTMEYEDGLVDDIEEYFNKSVPKDIEYEHNNRWHDGNGYSHIRSSLLKTSQTFQVEKGNVLLGTWQQIILIDFDNKQRDRVVSVKVLG